MGSVVFGHAIFAFRGGGSLTSRQMVAWLEDRNILSLSPSG